MKTASMKLQFVLPVFMDLYTNPFPAFLSSDYLLSYNKITGLYTEKVQFYTWHHYRQSRKQGLTYYFRLNIWHC